MYFGRGCKAKLNLKKIPHDSVQGMMKTESPVEMVASTMEATSVAEIGGMQHIRNQRGNKCRPCGVSKKG